MTAIGIDPTNSLIRNFYPFQRPRYLRLARLGCILALVIFAAACAYKGDRPQDDGRESIVAIGEMFVDVGAELRAAKDFPTLANAFETIAALLSETRTKMAGLQKTGAPVRDDLLLAYDAMSRRSLDASAAAATRNLSSLGAPMASLQKFLRYHALVGPEEVNASLSEAVARAGSARRAILFGTDPLVADLALSLARLDPADIETATERLVGLDDPALREILELDSPQVEAGLEALATAEAAAAFQTYLASPGLITAGELAFIQSTQLLGAQLADFGNALLGVVVIVVVASLDWDDECSPEGVKGNCAPGFVKFVTAGQTPESEAALLEFADKLPWGKVVSKGGATIIKATQLIDAFLECTYDVCEDTPCLPWLDPDLEWVEADDPAPIRFDNISGNPGASGSWPPLGSWGHNDKQAFERSLQNAGRRCAQCRF